MRRIHAMVFWALIVLGAATAAAEPLVVESKITEVTVYSDRARITRAAAVKVSPSATVVLFKKLPGWVDDGSVRLALVPAEAGEIVDVQVRRDYLALATDKAYLDAAAAVQEVADQIAGLNDELAVLDAQARQIDAIKVFSLEKLPRDAALREVKVESYAQVVQFIAASLREVAQARRAVETRRRELMPELAARQKRLQELQGLTQLEETSVLVTIEGRRTANADLHLTYMLPGATWEPAHELRARGRTPDAVELTSFAVVTQTTGEDWEGVRLSFSAQSSTETNRIPHLGALTLGDSGVAARIMQDRMESFQRAQAAFAGQNRMWNKLNAPLGMANQMEVYDNNLDQFQVVQARTVATFQELGKRGTSTHFPGNGRPTVRADGHPVRVPIGKATLAAEQSIVAVPEQSLNAVRTAKMENASAQPILPGAVALYQDGAFLGMTDLDFVAEGESFSVFLGVADQVKLARVLDRKHSSIVRKKRTRMKVAFEVSVQNLSDRPVTVDLADRIPVSENKEIEIDDVEITGDKNPDSRGLLKWKLTLAPKEVKKFRIAYRLEYPPALVQQMHYSRMQQKAAMPSAQSYDFESDDVSEQITELEKSFF